MRTLSITLKDLFDIPSAVIYNPDSYKPASSVSIDSRTVKKKSLFVAIEGEKFDGHDFVKEAINKGASSILINEKKYNKFNSLNIPIVTVKDTTIALGFLAKVWREKLRTKVIALTGSAGKTTTKEILSILLNEKYSINKTLENNNNHIGVPLTILSTNNKHDFLVLELGTNHFGEIAYTANIAQPDFAIITNIGNSHLEFLKNKNGVYKEKVELFKATVKNNGVLFINNDDKKLRNSFPDYHKRISFGIDQNSDVKGKILNYGFLGKPLIEIYYKNFKMQQLLPIYGEQNARNFLAAAAVALKLGLTKKEIEKASGKIKSIEKRLNVKKYNSFILIDDSYNANPESMKSSLGLLGKIKKFDKKIAILGDMYELGNDAKKFHKALFPFVKKSKIEVLFTIGKFMKELDGLFKGNEIIHKYFSNRTKLFEALKKLEINNSVILVKGSRRMKMEEFVKVIEEKAND
jgi:UDP-N-acetylmuramoyl-tripeptide--D-alanyl-D-alanine ligase